MMAGAMKELNWEIFLRLHRDKVVGVVIHTPLYNLIAENFPIEFVTKLISTVIGVPDVNATISAAVIIQDVVETSHFLQKVKSGISVETMRLFRRSAIDLMTYNLGVIEYEECGRALASKLLRSSLESNGVWQEFLELMQPDFCLSQPILLDVFCDQPLELARKFASLLEPSIRANRPQLIDTLLNQLEEGDDHRPYFVLANVCGLFTELKWSILMEVAIMSPFFDNVSSCSSRVSAASSLRFCIDHAADFQFSDAMINKLEDIIHRLHRSREASEKHVGVELYEAFGRRVMRAPIPRMWQYTNMHEKA